MFPVGSRLDISFLNKSDIVPFVACKAVGNIGLFYLYVHLCLSDTAFNSRDTCMTSLSTLRFLFLWIKTPSYFAKKDRGFSHTLREGYIQLWPSYTPVRDSTMVWWYRCPDLKI